MSKISFPHYSDKAAILSSLDLSMMRVDVNYKIDGSALVIELPTERGGHPKFFRRLGGSEIVFSVGDPFSDHYLKAVTEMKAAIENVALELSMLSGWTLYVEFFEDTDLKNKFYLSFMTMIGGGIVVPSNPFCLRVATLLNINPPPIIFSGKVLPGSRIDEVIRANSVTEAQVEEISSQDTIDAIAGISTDFEGVAVFAQSWDSKTYTWKVVDARFREHARRRRSKTYSLAAAVGECISGAYPFDKSPALLLPFEVLKDVGPAPYDRLIFSLVTWMVRVGIADEVAKLDEVKTHEESKNFVNRLSFQADSLDCSSVERLLYRTMYFAVKKAAQDTSPRFFSAGFVEFLKAAANAINVRTKKFNTIVAGLPHLQETEATLIVGRFQPFHKGHEEMIKSAKNEVVILHRSRTGGPISRSHLFDIEVPGKTVVIVEEGSHVGVIVSKCREIGYEVTEIICGADRADDYRRLVEPVNKVRGLDLAFSIDVVIAPRITSGTDVRRFIAAGRQDLFEYHTPRIIHPWFHKFADELSKEKTK